MKAICVILVLLLVVPKHKLHRVSGQTAVPSEHIDLMQEQYEQFMQSQKNKNQKGQPWAQLIPRPELSRKD